MTVGAPTNLPTRRPSVAYGLAFASAMVGAVCLAVAVNGTCRELAGMDGLGAMNTAGVPALIAAWLLAFYARLAFYNRVPATGQAFVRQSLRILLIGEVVAAVIGSWFVLTSGATSGDLIGILIVGDILQIGTAYWALRYYSE